MTQRERFAIVWQPFRDRSPTGRVLLRPVTFPFLLAGDQRRALEDGRPARLDARALVEGILIGFEAPPPVGHSASAEEMRDALSDTVTTFRAASLEILLLDASAHIREHFGLVHGRVALMTAREIMPQSAMITSDLVMTVWSLLREVGAEDYSGLLGEIIAIFPGLNLDLVDPAAVDTLVLAYAAALTFTVGRRADRDEFVRAVATSRVRDRAVSGRLRYLLSAPEPRLESVL